MRRAARAGLEGIAVIANNHGPARLVRDFHRAFELDAPDRPVTWIPDALANLRRRLHAEEAAELAEAADGSIGGLVKEACDLAYVAIGTPVALGVDFESAFREVHRSNMSKLGEDGRPTYRSDGKVLKGASYRPPDLARVLGRHA